MVRSGQAIPTHAFYVAGPDNHAAQQNTGQFQSIDALRSALCQVPAISVLSVTQHRHRYEQFQLRASQLLDPLQVYHSVRRY